MMLAEPLSVVDTRLGPFPSIPRVSSTSEHTAAKRGTANRGGLPEERWERKGGRGKKLSMGQDLPFKRAHSKAVTQGT